MAKVFQFPKGKVRLDAIERAFASLCLCFNSPRVRCDEYGEMAFINVTVSFQFPKGKVRPVAL